MNENMLITKLRQNSIETAEKSCWRFAFCKCVTVKNKRDFNLLCVPLKYIAWNVKMYRIDLCYFAVIKGNKVTSCHTKKK